MKKLNPKTKKLIKKILLITGLSIIGLILLSIIFVGIYVVTNSPEFDPDRMFRAESTVLYTKDNEEFAKLGREKREKVSYEDLPEVLINAIVSTEDARFFQHNGFDFPRFMNASIKQAFGNSSAGGASTITMQVVYNNFTERSKNKFEDILRKFTDIYMSIFHIEKQYSKQEIMEFYVNTPFLGDESYGVQQASLNYFGKDVKDLTLPEASLIAGLFQAPTTYNPYKYPEKAEKRRATVLYLMKRHGYITEEEERYANSISIESMLKKSSKDTNPFQGFIDTVVEEVIAKTGDNPYDVPMKIHTTMDKRKQEEVEKILSGETYTWENPEVQAGFTVTNINTGAIVAIGAGRNRDGERSLNLATTSAKQPGSTAKPIFDYAPAIEFNNWSTYQQILDEPHNYTNGPEIGNWDGKYMGLMTLRNALSLSRNTPALRTFQQVKNSDILSLVQKLGIKPEIENGKIHQAHALGSFTATSPLELGAAYGAFGNGGYYYEPYSVTKLEYRNSNEIYEHKENKVQAMSPETAYMITSVLMTSVNEGLSSGARYPGVQMAAKTGTTNFSEDDLNRHKLPYTAINDLWTVGYSPEYAVSLWYGYKVINNKYYNTVADTVYKDRLFQAIMKNTVDKTDKAFNKPAGVVEVEVEKETIPAMLPSENTPADMRIKELFKKGTEPTEVSPRFQKLPDVNNLSVKNEKGVVNLTWEYTLPPQINPTTLKTHFDTYYEKVSQKYYEQRLSYINNNLGGLVYEIYLKDKDKQTLIATAKENKFTYKTTAAMKDKEYTFIVKASYGNNKSMTSNGTSKTITIGDTPTEEIVSVTLNGKKDYMLKINDTYTEPNPAFSVLDNGLPITSGYTQKKVITNKKGETVTKIDNTKEEVYTITYTITYKSNNYTLTRTITFTP